jgi:hypothetical protein
MDRNINFEPFIEISSIVRYEHHTLINKANIILEIDGNYFYIEDDIEKLKDVSAMPSYIKEDWVKYNLRDLNMFTINKHIEELNKRLENAIATMYIKEKEEKLSLLKTIRRDFIINGII